MLLDVIADHIAIDSNRGESLRGAPVFETFSSVFSSYVLLIFLFLCVSPATFAADPVDAHAQYRLYDPSAIPQKVVVLTCEFAGCANNTFIGRLPDVKVTAIEGLQGLLQRGRAVSVLEVFDIHPSAPPTAAAEMSKGYLLKWLQQTISVETNGTKSPLSYREIVQASSCPRGMNSQYWEYFKAEYKGLLQAHKMISSPEAYRNFQSTLSQNSELQYPTKPGTFRWPEWIKSSPHGPSANALKIPDSPFRTGSIKLNQGIYRPDKYETLIKESASGKGDAIDHYQRLGLRYFEQGPNGQLTRVSDQNLKAALESVTRDLADFEALHSEELKTDGPIRRMYLNLKESVKVLSDPRARANYDRAQMTSQQIESRLPRLDFKPMVHRGGFRDYFRWQKNRFLDARDARRAKAAAKASANFEGFKSNFGKNIASAAKQGAIAGLGSTAGVWSYLYLELLIRRQVTGDASIQAAIDDYLENRIGQIGQLTTGFLAGATWSFLFDFYKTTKIKKRWKMLGTIAPTALITTLSQDVTPRFLRKLDLERLPINYTEWRGHSARSNALEEILEGLSRYPSFSCRDMPAGQIVISGGLTTSTLISLKQILLDARPWIKIYALDGKYNDLVLNLAAMSKACEGGQTINMTNWANLVGRMKSFHDQRSGEFRNILESHVLESVKATWEQEPNRIENLLWGFAKNTVAVWGMYKTIQSIRAKITGKASQDFEEVAQKLESTKNPITTRKFLLRMIESNSKVWSGVGKTLAHAEGPVLGTVTAAAMGFAASFFMINSGRLLGWFNSLFSSDGTDFAKRALDNRNQAIGIVEKYLTLKDDELCNMFDRKVIPNCVDHVAFDAVKAVFQATSAAESALLKEIPGLTDIWDTHREEYILGDLAGELKRWGQVQEKEEKKIYVKLRWMDYIRRGAKIAGDPDFDSNGGYLPWHTSEADGISLFRERERYNQEYLRDVAPIGYNAYFDKLMSEKNDLLQKFAKVRTNRIGAEAKSVFFSKTPSESLLQYDAKANAGLPTHDQLWSPSNLSWSYWKQLETFRWILMQAHARTKNTFDAEQEIEELNDLFTALKPGIVNSDSLRNITAAFEKGKVRIGDPLGPYDFLREALKLTGSDPESRAKRIGLRWMALYHYIAPLMFDIIQRHSQLPTRLREVVGASAMIPEESIEARQQKFFDAVGAMTTGLVANQASSEQLMKASGQRQAMKEEEARKEEARRQEGQSKEKTAEPKADPKAESKPKPASPPIATAPAVASAPSIKPDPSAATGTAPTNEPKKPFVPPARPEHKDKPDALALDIMSSMPGAAPAQTITIKKPTKSAPPAPAVEKK